MKRRGITTLLLATTAFLAAFLFGCGLSKEPPPTESSSSEQSEYSEVQPCEHVYGEWKPWEEPNCEYDGLETRSCTLCGEILQFEQHPKLTTHELTITSVDRRCP